MLKRKFTVCRFGGNVRACSLLCAFFAQSMLHLFLSPTHTFLFPLAVLHSRLNCQLIAITMFIYRFSFIPPTTHSNTQFSIMSRSAVQKISFLLLFAYRSLFISCFEYFHSPPICTV